MKYFEITGIKPPGRVHLIRRGEVRLYELSDEELYEIWKQKLCPYVKMTPAGYRKYFPSKKGIRNDTLKTQGSTAKKTTAKKSGYAGNKASSSGKKTNSRS